jgi:hypothetical protein
VTKAEWLACEDPHQMMFSLADVVGKSKAGRRKIRLLMSACCRQAWHHFVDPRGRELIEASEAYADNLLSYREFRGLWDKVLNAHAGGAKGTHLACMASHYQIWAAAKDGWPRAITGESVLRASEKAALLRCVFGNPFRPVSVDPSLHTSTVIALARQMYESRDFSPMPILADALQDAGCEIADILDHCRGPGPHVRGCWVADLLLGKE